MAKHPAIDVRIADLPQMQEFTASVNALLEALDECDGLPEPVTSAMERLRGTGAPGGGGDPDPEISRESSEEDRIRRAMAEAMAHPGRIVTAE